MIARVNCEAVDEEARFWIELIPGIVHWGSALTVGIGACLLNGPRVVAVDAYPERRVLVGGCAGSLYCRDGP